MGGAHPVIVQIIAVLNTPLIEGGKQRAGVLLIEHQIHIFEVEQPLHHIFKLALKGIQQIFKALKLCRVTQIKAELGVGGAHPAVVQRQLQDQGIVEAGAADVVGLGRDRRVVTAGGDIFVGIRLVDPRPDKGTNGLGVTDKFQLAAQIPRHLTGAADKFRRIFWVDAHHHVFAGQSDRPLGVQDQVGDCVDCVLTCAGAAANGDALHTGRTGHHGRHNAVLGVDDRVHLDHHEAKQLPGFVIRQNTGRNIPLVIWRQILIHTAHGHTGAPALQHQAHIEEPAGLQRLPERVGRGVGHLAADADDLLQLRLPGLRRGSGLLFGQRSIARGEALHRLVALQHGL